jgi:hypothetical protein
MTVQRTLHEWSKDALFSKAQLYAEKMEQHEDSNLEFGIWSALTLEMLVRAAVASVSPVLVADAQDWNNLLYALGGAPKKAKFIPKSAAITDLVARAEDLCPGFTREHANFCASHFARRNSEIHTGNLAFENIGSSTWTPSFYSTCEVLLAAIGETLATLFDKETADRAQEEIAALRDDTAKAVNGTISAHKAVWAGRTDDEREASKQQANTSSLRHYGHRVSCPACGSTALIQGTPAGAAKQSVEEGGILERQVMKPEAFACVACGLRISGYSKLLAAGLGNSYVATAHYDAVEYFEIDIDKHIRSLMEEDNNEY